MQPSKSGFPSGYHVAVICDKAATSSKTAEGRRRRDPGCHATAPALALQPSAQGILWVQRSTPTLLKEQPAPALAPTLNEMQVAKRLLTESAQNHAWVQLAKCL